MLALTASAPCVEWRNLQRPQLAKVEQVDAGGRLLLLLSAPAASCQLLLLLLCSSLPTVCQLMLCGGDLVQGMVAPTEPVTPSFVAAPLILVLGRVAC